MTSHVSDYGLKLKFDLRPAQMEDLLSDIIAKAKKKQDKIASIPHKKRTFENTVRALAIANGTAQNKSAQCSFPLLVFPTKEVRDIANTCNITFTDFLIETNMRRDLYEAVRHVADRGGRLDSEENRLLQKMLSDFERNGVHLEEEKYTRVKFIRKRINDLSLKFNQNVNEDETAVSFTREQLQGMSEDFLDNLKRVGDKYLVSLKYPELYPILEECKIPETRRIMDITNGERCVDANLPLLKEIIALRQEAALLQGYDCDASYELAIKMAKDKDTVRKFLYDMSEKLEPMHTLEMTEMLALKKAECAKNGWKFDGQITSWDFRYYQRMYLRTKFNVDHEEIRQYFPFDFTVRGILDVYQHIFDLKFEEDVGAHVWHPDVKRFSVLGKDGEFYGHFYLDMFPRPGKYSHAACFPIQLRQETEKGMHYTATAIVCNFTQSTAEKPSLLQFSEVQTFFHEFGHLMHSICSKSRFARLNWTWTAVEQDFLECPSMMLEQWACSPVVLERVSGFYKDTDVKLPKPLLESLIRAKNADMALNTRMIIFQSLFDLDMHSTGDSDFWDKAWRKYKFEQTGIRSPLEVKPYASWMHVTSGYNAGYYSYIWSEVFSKDMFAKFLEAKEGALDREMGVKFRKTILEPCCIEDGMDMLKKFLGREPTQKAFFDDLGIKT